MTASAGQLVVDALGRDPGRPAFVHGDRAVSYPEAARAVGRVLAAFDAHALRRGDTVLQVAPNRPESWFVQAACALGGLRAVSVWPPPADAAALAARCRADLVVTDHDGLLAAAPAPLHCRAEPEDVVRLAFTSGATGPPKGVLLSGRALAGTALATLAASEWPADVRLLLAEPVAGGFGTMVLPALLRGGTVVLLDHDGGVDPGAFAAAVTRHGPTLAYLFTPSLLRIVREAPEFARSLQLVVHSGSGLAPDDLAAALERFGPVLAQVYGQTECPKALAFLGRAAHRTGLDPTDVGVPFPGTRTTLLGGSGDVGELCVQGPAVMSGYWPDPGGTHHGWHRTGDVCRRDRHGHLHIIGRTEDAIDRAGETVHPAELEAAIGVPCAVLGVPGGRVVAVAERGHRDGLAAAVAGLPVDGIAEVEAIPMLWIGRIDRVALRALLLDVEWLPDPGELAGDAVRGGPHGETHALGLVGGGPDDQ